MSNIEFQKSNRMTSELKEVTDLKENTNKQMNEIKNNMQDIKEEIMDLEGEMKIKGTDNVINNIITETFPNLQKGVAILYLTN
jgi:hypothetical protein